jgi:TFIIF-interacting CTD phosphatase-like protein
MDDQNENCESKESKSCNVRIEPNEIILNHNSNDNDSTAKSNELSLPIVSWKVKNGSTVRIGEILAYYSFDNCNDNDDDSNNNVMNMKCSTNTTCNSIENANSTCCSNTTVNAGATSALTNDTPTTAIVTDKVTDKVTDTTTATTKPSIIRPRKRNRYGNLVHKKGNVTHNEPTFKKTHTPTATTTATTMEMDDVLKSFQRKSHVKNNNDEENKINDDNIHIGTNPNNNVPHVIKATLDGVVHIYDTIQKRIIISSNNNETTKKKKQQIVFILGKIDECPHPAVIDNLCAVCGKSIIHSNASLLFDTQDKRSMDSSSTNNSHNSTQSNNHNHKLPPPPSHHHQQQQSNKRDAFTLSGGVTVSISQDYAQSLSKNTSQSLRAARKLSLVLDLDHTLLHATADRRASRWMSTVSDLHIVLLPLMEGQPMYNVGTNYSNNNNVMMPHYVKLRPHLAEFISGLLDKYEISIYTAGTRTYANKIADVISRHVLDHQRREESKAMNCNQDKEIEGDQNVINNYNQNHDKCLDEGELNDLKQKVARIEERMRWDKSRKERQEYVKRMNEQFELEKKKEKDKKDCLEIDLLSADDTNAKEDGNEKIRKRVRFTEDVISNEEKLNPDGNKVEKSKTNIVENDNSEVALEALKTKLRSAEERENAAQALRKKIFGSRIISRTDLPDLGRDVKSLERVCPCGNMAAIVDDREDVWANAENNSTGRKGEPPHNMLLVKPYHFAPFVNFADVNNASGVDLSVQSLNGKKVDDTDESDELQLLWTKHVLTRVHDKYYDPKLSMTEQDHLTVPSILTNMRRNVLSQSFPPTKVLLSGLVPLHLQNVESSNEKVTRHNVVRYVEELGGKVLTNISDDITHVIAAKDGTDKILQARRIPGCAVVRISWLMECYWSITRRDIEKHYLGPPPRPREEGNNIGGSSKKLLLIESDDEDDEDDEDDLLMEFKKRMAELQAKE